MKRVLCLVCILVLTLTACGSPALTDPVDIAVQFNADEWYQEVELSVEKGTSVHDATYQALTDLGVDFEVSAMGDFVYYSSINGYTEKLDGIYSGWVYEVNDTEVFVGAGLYDIDEEITITWTYITN